MGFQLKIYWQGLETLKYLNKLLVDPYLRKYLCIGIFHLCRIDISGRIKKCMSKLIPFLINQKG